MGHQPGYVSADYGLRYTPATLAENLKQVQYGAVGQGRANSEAADATWSVGCRSVFVIVERPVRAGRVRVVLWRENYPCTMRIVRLVDRHELGGLRARFASNLRGKHARLHLRPCRELGA
jgi:hypothetical protein